MKLATGPVQGRPAFRRDQVEQAPGIDAARSRQKDHCQGAAQKTAVERHAAILRARCPGDWRNSAGNRKQDVADTAAENDAERGVDQQVVDQFRPERRLAVPPKLRIGEQALGVPPAEQDADDIAKPVPMDSQWRSREGAGLDNTGLMLGNGGPRAATGESIKGFGFRLAGGNVRRTMSQPRGPIKARRERCLDLRPLISNRDWSAVRRQSGRPVRGRK